MSDDSIIGLQTETNLFGQEISTGAEIDRDTLASGLYHVLKDITVEEFVLYLTNSFEAMIDYADLCAGLKTGQRISLLFNPHRLDTGTKRFPISLYAKLKDESFVRGLARVVLLNKKKGNIRDLLYASIGMGVQGTSYVQEFPPHVARDLALEYNLSKNSRVLDPCAGWGGRMLGFSAVVDNYTCCEPSSRTASGLRELLKFIKSFRASFNATIHESPFEDVALDAETFDFAFTSPPYYDTETYAPGEVTNSFNRYASFDDWCLGFYAPLVHRAMLAVKPDGHFVINIGSRLYPLNTKLFEIAEGIYHVEKQKGRLSASNGLGKTGEGETFYEIKRLPTTTRETIAARLDELSAKAPARKQAAPQLPIVVSEPAAVAKITEILVEQEAPKQETDRVAEVFAAVVAAPAEEPEPVAVESTPTQVLETSAQVIAAALKQRGHVLLFNTASGKLAISNSSQLTTEDRALIKEHYDALIPLAEPFTPAESQTATTAPPVVDEQPATSLFTSESDTPVNSLAMFLGESRELPPDWKAQPPPSLDGINDVVLNFETDGVEWWNGARPVSVTVGTLDRKLVRFLPFRFQGGGNLDEAQIKEWAQRELRGKRIININTRFEVHMSREWGHDLEEAGCTVTDIAHHAALIDDNRRRFALDVLLKDYLGGVEVERVDERIMATYAAHEVARRAEYQVQAVAKLYDVFWPILNDQDLQRVRQLEDNVIYAVCEMEKNGAPIDLELLEQFHAEAMREHGALLKEISAEVGFAFDHSAESWQRMFEKYGLPVSYLEKEAEDDEDKATFKESVLDRIDHPIVRKAQRAARISSLDSKTFSAYRKIIDKDGILRFQLNQLKGDSGGTVTGRFSAGYIQQVANYDNHHADWGNGEIDDDKKINPADLYLFPRRLYVPRFGDYLSADAAQIEYRIFAHHAKNPKVLAAYRENPRTSFHKLIWGMIKAYKADMLYSHQKNLNFMTIYGGKLIKTAAMMGFITHEEAAEIRAQKNWNHPKLAPAKEIQAIYDRELPEVKPLLAKAAHLAQSKCNDYCRKNAMSRDLHRRFQHHGYVRTLTGRRSRFPTNQRLHKALNSVIQGSAADIMKQKLVELHNARKDTGFIMRMTVHDEVCGDSPNEECKKKVDAILNEQSFKLDVPILWDVDTGRNWAEAKGK